MSYSFQKIADSWDSMSDVQKHEAFEGTKYLKPTAAELSTLNEFKILSENKISVSITGVPKNQIVLPTTLISLKPYQGIEKAIVVNAITKADSMTNPVIKLAITKDDGKYYTFDFSSVSWQEIIPTADDVIRDGIDIDSLPMIVRTDWDNFTVDTENIGIAYAISIDDVDDVAEIDELQLDVEMRGSWNKAIHGIDYDYGYPFYDLLRVKLLKDGSYKINYHD